MQPSPQTDPLKGKVLANTYRLGRLLGQGGMGKVYEAGHLRLSKKRYAVKLLQPGTDDDSEAYARFRREAEIATEIGNPHIVDVHDFNITEEGQPFIVMELLEGEDLFDHYKRVRRLPWHEVLEIMGQVAGALAAAHRRGIVHRDLKPENIYLTHVEGELHVKLLDFGLSKIKHSRSRLTRKNAVFGTPDYMAPEQASGQGEEVDHRTDIFALGVIVYQCLAGVLPFEAAAPLGVLYRVCNDEPRPLTEIVPGLTAEVDRVVARAMAKRKVDRYDSAEAFVEDLAAALARSPRVEGLPIQRESSSPATRVSAGEIRSQPSGESPLLPPGAPPLPVDVLDAGGAEPSVMVSRSLAPGELDTSGGLSGELEGRIPSIHDLETGEVGALGPQLHELDTVRRTLSTEERAEAAGLHDLSTGDVEPLAVDLAVELLVSGHSGQTAPYTKKGAALDKRQRLIAYLVVALVVGALGVAAIWLAAVLAGSP